jgi:hypothetical protein
MLHRGDIVALVVEKSWAPALRAGRHLGKPVRTSAEGVEFAVKIAEIDDSLGLWVESREVSRTRSKSEHKVLAPWRFVLSAVTQPVHPEPKRKGPGFTGA